MWLYQKQLPYPVNVKTQNLSLAKTLLTQCGGPEGAWMAALSYLNQRHSMPRKEAKALLTDLATEELAHGEMLSALLHQLTGRLPPDQRRETWDAGKRTNLFPCKCTWAFINANAQVRFVMIFCKTIPSTPFTSSLSG